VEKSNPDFSTVPTALGNPAKDAGFPHFPSHDGGGYRLPLKTKPAKIAGPVRFLRRAENTMTVLEQVSALQSPPSFENLLLATSDMRTGLLGNAYAQVVHVSSFDVDSVLKTYGNLLGGMPPSLKLAMLKRQKFTPEGRQARIEKSLAALNAAQPTDLTLAQWKSLLEEVEDED
jgi:hypothetical protein